MNLSGIMKPLAEKLGDLTSILQELLDNQKAQVEILKSIDEKLTKEDTCKSP